MTKSVRQGSQDRIEYTLLVDYKEVSPDTATILVRSPGGKVLVNNAVATIQGSLCSYSQIWNANDFTLSTPCTRFYHAQWTFNLADGDVHQRDIFFEVTKRAFVSEVTDQDCYNEQDGVEEQATQILDQNGQPEGLKQFRKNAWRDIERYIESSLSIHPSIVADASSFERAHVYRTLQLFYRSERFGSIGSESEAAFKSKEYEEEYLSARKQALNGLSVDADNDNLVSEREERIPFPEVRFRK